MNFVLVGPCGVGKSAVGGTLADRLQITYLDFDALKSADRISHPGEVSPFSVSSLDLPKALPPILSKVASGFVLDIGGGTVFLPNKDNQARFSQILWLKNTYRFHLIVLIAAKNILSARFTLTKNRKESEFSGVWAEWSKVSFPYWLHCGDFFIDTSLLSIEQVVDRIISVVNLDGQLMPKP